MDTVEVKSHELCMDTVHDLGVGKVSEAGLDVIVQLPHGSGDEMFCTKLNEILLKLEGDPIFSMLELQLNPEETLTDLFKAIKTEISEHPNPQVKCCCVCLLGKGGISCYFCSLGCENHARNFWVLCGLNHFTHSESKRSFYYCS